jgi:hypothetical protein
VKQKKVARDIAMPVPNPSTNRFYVRLQIEASLRSMKTDGLGMVSA